MKKVLVVIDNILQYDRIKKLIDVRKPDANFTFKHSIIKSAIWEHPDFKNENNSIIDVKKQKDEIINSFDLVISVHCFQFFPKELVNGVRCINIHPGYNPINRGWYPQVFAIVNDLPIGATIHEMDEKLDNGPVIAREFVEKYPWDTSLTIYNRVLEKEMKLFEKNIDAIIHGTYKTILPENNGNIYSKNDFKNLCKIELNEEKSFRYFYDLLRALSHGDYKNAFIIDPETGKKIYIKLEISYE
jgi:dTDP-4-amino-4,6-dideoxyglucose formyltransferase